MSKPKGPKPLARDRDQDRRIADLERRFEEEDRTDENQDAELPRHDAERARIGALAAENRTAIDKINSALSEQGGDSHDYESFADEVSDKKRANRECVPGIMEVVDGQYVPQGPKDDQDCVPGTMEVVDGQYVPDYEPPMELSCDGLDNDCNGSVDEEGVTLSSTTCHKFGVFQPDVKGIVDETAESSKIVLTDDGEIVVK